MASSPCPENPELLALVMGSPIPERVRRHVDNCAGCRLRVDRLHAELSAVRQVAGELPAAGEEPMPVVAAVAETASCPSDTEPSEDDAEAPEPAEPRARPESIGRYRVVGALDSGGQAAVYRAVHPTLPRDLAIKIAHESGDIDHRLLRADAEILCELDHPNLVRVYDLDVHEGHPFVAMEFVRGRNLHQVAEQLPPSPYQAAAWVAEIARALDYVHRRGVVHQDIKPRNIMLDESGRPRLIDFGMARWRHVWTGRRSGPSGGTLAFMAPEQARGETKRVGEASDIFGLGGVLYFLLTGKSPFGGGTRQEQWRRASQCEFDRNALRAKGLPRRLERIVLKAMAAEPADRYASADQMADALDDFSRRPRRLALEAGTLLLAALAVMLWSWWPRPVSESQANTTLVPAPPPNPALKIESLQVELHPRAPGDPDGVIGVNVFAGRVDQDVRVQFRLSMPAYCFLIALNPNGEIQPCYPRRSADRPSATTLIDFPNEPGSGFGLTEGMGTQVFVLVASTKPLPSYDEWSKALGELPWKPVQTDTVWRYDGRRFESDHERGGIRPLADLPSPLDAACRVLQAGPGVEAIRAMAFPVEPQRQAKKAQHAD